MNKTKKLMKVIIPLALVCMIGIGAQAAVYTFFSSEEVTVNIEGLEVYVDGNLAQDLETTDTVAFLAGDNVTTAHIIYYTGNGATLTVDFDIVGDIEDGLNVTFLNDTYAPITGIELQKGVNNTFYIDYKANAMMKTGTSTVNWTVST